MYISLGLLARMTLYAFFLGIAFGAVYDVVRITRVMLGVRYGGRMRSADALLEKNYPLIGRVQRKNGGRLCAFLRNAYVFVSDLVYFTAAGVVFCVFIYYTDSGIFRWQAPAALALGFFVYYRTIGVAVISFAEVVCAAIKIFVKISVKAIAIPIMFMYNIVAAVSKKIFDASFGTFIFLYKRRKTKLFMKKLLLGADEIFGERMWDDA